MSSRLRRVVVDLTPMLPGGANGGAKVIALSLVRELAELAPETKFVLLTSAPGHAELAALESSNVRRQQLEIDSVPTQADAPAMARARVAARQILNTLLPSGARSHMKDAVWQAVKRQRRQQVASVMKRDTDLHFCPFTAPFFADPNIPLVSVVHDLQYLAYPEFFTDRQRQERHQHFLHACARADRLICVSEFVRQTVLANGALAPEAAQTIHSTVVHTHVEPPDATAIVRRILDRVGVRTDRYLLYPANAWPHKNHRRLLEGFAALLERQPATRLALVCTGAPGAAFDEITALARSLLPPDRFGFAGYTSEAEFSALLHKCGALVFPSLYEGFGLPLVEAMACGRPVLCSNVSSLPEIAGNAALFFDPCNPVDIADAIARLESDSGLEATLIARGKKRAAEFGSARDMAARYLDAFETVVAARQGTHRDGAGEH